LPGFAVCLMKRALLVIAISFAVSRLTTDTGLTVDVESL